MISSENWNYDEFIHYLMIHAALSDFKLAPEEITLLEQYIPKVRLAEFLKLYKHNSDYENIQLLMYYAQIYSTSVQEKDEIIAKIMDVFNSDDEFNIHEKTAMKGIEMILNTGIKK